jgi:hypothetical protein
MGPERMLRGRVAIEWSVPLVPFMLGDGGDSSDDDDGDVEVLV